MSTSIKVKKWKSNIFTEDHFSEILRNLEVSIFSKCIALFGTTKELLFVSSLKTAPPRENADSVGETRRGPHVHQKTGSEAISKSSTKLPQPLAKGTTFDKVSLHARTLSIPRQNPKYSPSVLLLVWSPDFMSTPTASRGQKRPSGKENGRGTCTSQSFPDVWPHVDLQG